jgi:hypothetical protein
MPPTQTGKLLVFLPLHFGITLHDLLGMSLMEHAAFALRVLLDFASEGGATRVAIASWVLLVMLGTVLWARPGTRRYSVWIWLLVGCLLAQLALYAWAFPLLKLRYLINLLPVGLAVGVAAVGLLAKQDGGKLLARAHSIMTRVVGVSGGTGPRARPALRAAGYWALIALVLAGALAYAQEMKRQVNNYRYYVSAQDVRREVGVWLREHTPGDSLVALEPIGAIGFYSGRRVLDLGGLIDPGVWPFLSGGYSDGQAIARLLRERHADYLVDYTYPQGIGGVSAALPSLPGSARLVTIESALVMSGSRAEYGSYTIYAVHALHTR